MYELWDGRGTRPLGRWPTEAAALAAVRALLEGGPLVAADLILLECRSEGSAIVLARGAELAERAHLATVPTDG